jgi:N-acetylmuramoyl-L-alanine amidase
MTRSFIMVHHSLTADSQTVSWGAIERYHRETNGWLDIGYHAGVELVGTDYYALIGRNEQWGAAACKEGNMNVLALHVCCVGNYDLAPPPETLLAVLAHRVVLPWMQRYSIPSDRIIGHRDYATYKSCPGSQFDLDHLRRMVT